MKGKKLTFRMKKYVGSKMKLNPDDWLYLKNTPDEFVIMNRETKEKRTINKIEHNITLF